MLVTLAGISKVERAWPSNTPYPMVFNVEGNVNTAIFPAIENA